MNSHLTYLEQQVVSYRSVVRRLLYDSTTSKESQIRTNNTLDNFEDHVRDHERCLYRLALVKVLTNSGLFNGSNDNAILNAIELEMENPETLE